MRIALIHYRLVRNGGLETRLFNYLNHFSSQGHDVTLIVSKIDPEVIIPHGIRVHQVNLSKVPKPLRLYFFDRALKHVVSQKRFDLSFSLGRTAHQDIVLCPGNHLGYLKAMGQWWKSPADLLNISMDRDAFAKSQLILAASQMMKNELIQLYHVDELKVEVLYPPINDLLFHNAGKQHKSQWREMHGFSDSKKSILFLTTGNRRKGYHFLLQLMALLENEPIELIVAGVKPISSELGNVRYIGYCDHPEQLLWAADLMIHPALYEPFGQVVTESLQCGTPVLISDMVGAKEIVDASVGQVLSGFILEEWRTAILEMLSKEWKIPSNFAQKHGLTTAQHCERILTIASELN